MAHSHSYESFLPPQPTWERRCIFQLCVWVISKRKRTQKEPIFFGIDIYYVRSKKITTLLYIMYYRLSYLILWIFTVIFQGKNNLNQHNIHFKMDSNLLCMPNDIILDIIAKVAESFVTDLANCKHWYWTLVHWTLVLNSISIKCTRV